MAWASYEYLAICPSCDEVYQLWNRPKLANKLMTLHVVHELHAITAAATPMLKYVHSLGWRRGPLGRYSTSIIYRGGVLHSCITWSTTTSKPLKVATKPPFSSQRNHIWEDRHNRQKSVLAYSVLGCDVIGQLLTFNCSEIKLLPEQYWGTNQLDCQD